MAEDNPQDAELIMRELHRDGFEPEWERVETEEAFRASLRPEIDIILSDYQMPNFTGFRALEILNQSELPIPFILISGTIGEELAVTAMKNGATDYLLKDRLARLGPAVSLALEQSRLRKQREQTEEALHETEERFRQLAENIKEVFWVTNPGKNQILYVSPAYEAIWGRRQMAVFASPKNWLDAIHPEDKTAVEKAVATKQVKGSYNEEYRIVRPDGTIRWIHDRAFPVRNGAGEIYRIVGVAGDITERKEAEEVLKESERRFREMLENLDAIAITVDKSGAVTFCNDCFLKITGWARDEVMGADWWAKFIPETHANIRAMFFENIETGIIPAHYENPIKTRQEGLRDIAWSNTILRDAAGNVSGIAGIGEDMTERKRAEKALQLQEKQYRALFETHPSPTWVFDSETLKFLAVNKAAVQHYGYSRDEFLAMTIRDIRPVEDIPALLDTLAMKSRETHSAGVWRHLTRSGKIILAEVYVSATEFEGRPAQLSIAIDVTEQRKAQEVIRQSESRLRALVTSMEDVAMEFDVEGTYIAIWTTRDDLLSHPRSELIGRTISDLHGEDVAERFLATIRHVSQSRVAENLEYTMDVIDGARQFLARISPIVEADGSCERICMLSRDMTEQKKLEAQFLRAQRVESIGTLASGVAHDLNNILAPILMGAAVLHRTEMSASDEAILSTIETCAQRGADIVKQVLTFARGAEGERVVLQPANLIKDLGKIAEETFPKAITIRARFPEQLWVIKGDPTQLHQVLLNLCVNARDAMPMGGTLTLCAENSVVDEHYASMTPGAKAGPHVLLEVTDTGMGIPRPIINKIFDPFFTTKDVGKGTGLGLSTVFGIVKSHGGFIGVYSDVGRGTTFKIFLPAHMDESIASQSPEAVAPPSAHGELLLLVDDEKSILLVAQALLEEHGYQVLTAADAPEALAIFAMRQSEIHLVLTDLAMPFMDGVALIRTLRKMKSDVRIIASSGRGDQENHANELAALSVRACLTKPYNKSKLLRTLHDALTEAATLSPIVSVVSAAAPAELPPSPGHATGF